MTDRWQQSPVLDYICYSKKGGVKFLIYGYSGKWLCNNEVKTINQFTVFSLSPLQIRASFFFHREKTKKTMLAACAHTQEKQTDFSGEKIVTHRLFRTPIEAKL